MISLCYQAPWPFTFMIHCDFSFSFDGVIVPDILGGSQELSQQKVIAVDGDEFQHSHQKIGTNHPQKKAGRIRKNWAWLIFLLGHFLVKFSSLRIVSGSSTGNPHHPLIRPLSISESV